jgi:hypothetical protein
VTFAIDVVFFAPAFERCLQENKYANITINQWPPSISPTCHIGIYAPLYGL